MKSFVTPGSIEPLEARIAPAQIFVGAFGAVDSGKDTEYNETQPFDPKQPLFAEAGGNPADPIAAAVNGAANTYYIKLKAGDTIFQYVFGQGGIDPGYQPLLTVSKGTVVAFFVDGGTLNEVEAGELKSLSLGNGASFELSGALPGDVLTNYNDKTGTIDMAGLLGPKQSVGKISISGSVGGSIFAGGTINNVSVQGSVNEVLTGVAANGKAFSLLPGTGSGDGVLAVAPAAGEAGGSILNARIGSANVIAAGDGGVGGKGGSLSFVQIINDFDGIVLRAGNGGNGTAAKVGGGIGGDVKDIFVSGVTELPASPNSDIQIFAGNGGDAFGAGSGGKGGVATNVYVGFDAVSKKPVASAGVFNENVEVAGGSGGDGKTGGAGGNAANVLIRVSTAEDVLPPNPPDINELIVRAGDGGAATDPNSGKAGAGGSVSKTDVRNLHTATFDPDILIQAGNGGAANNNASGANGGSISELKILGYNANVFAGSGSDGKTGGIGGSLTKVEFLQDDVIRLRTGNAGAGEGGDAANGTAGKGGSVTTLSVLNADLATFNVNPGTSGNGGVSTKGKGGEGGSVNSFSIIDIDSGFFINGGLAVRAGNGGAGDAGGGKGGAVNKVDFFGQDLGVTVVSGAGGNALVNGVGGVAGAINTLNLTAFGLQNSVPVSGNITAGNGGNGAGKGAGGAGGDMKLVSLFVDGDVNVLAGDGGNGVAGASGSGKGGSLASTGAFANFGTGVLAAGDAGAIGNKAANGGSVLGGGGQLSALRAADSLTITAGNGANGGAGGDINGLSFGSTSDSLRPTPAGNILVKAGDGSGFGTLAGKGGSVINISGNQSSGAGTTTSIIAGDGGGVATKGAVGGSLSGITISGVGDDTPIDPVTLLPVANFAANPVTIIFEAGDGGDSPAGSAGAKGGDVKGVAVTNLDPDAKVRSVAAGDGGDADLAKGKGGMGGTVDNVRVLGGVDLVTGAVLSGDLGIRSGQVYGYATMGGVFAGASGVGAKAGLAGNVTNVSADSIAVIVAGKGAAPELVEKVEKISLNSLNRLKTAGTSPFTITYNTNQGTTVVLPGNADADDVETAVNAIGGVAPLVNVIRTQNSSFQLTGVNNGDIAQYAGTEQVPVAVSELFSGTQTFATDETAVGTATTVEEQFFQPFAQGVYTLAFGADETPQLAANANAAAVQAALNNLNTITVAGGVVVTGDALNGFDITFNLAGVRAPIIVQAQVPEQQVVDVLGVGSFQLSFGAQTTALLAANATAAAVDAALDGIVGGAGVNVVDGPAGSSSYIVTFNDTPDPDPDLLTGLEFIPMNSVTIADGTAGTPEVQGVSFVPRNTFTPADYAAANLVGAIADPNEIGSPVFKFTKGAGNVGAGFELGDLPIDGLVMARTFNQATVNFTPEAKYVTTDKGKPLPVGQDPFFDFNNKI